jgi:uncharacterized damage-inducible protein DinB
MTAIKTQFISDCLREVHIRLMGSCKELNREQVLWRPAPQANNIGFILWHVARAEESLTTSLRGRRPELWVEESWHKKFGQPVDSPDPGDRMGLQALAIPEPSVLLGYLEAVHDRTLELVSTLRDDELDRVPVPSRPGVSLGVAMRHLITHKNNHHGQIDYIRGLQDQSWDLPKGTGILLPPSS